MFENKLRKENRRLRKKTSNKKSTGKSMKIDAKVNVVCRTGKRNINVSLLAVC